MNNINSCANLYAEFVEAIGWQDTQALANICKNLNAKAISKMYSDRQAFLDHNWELDSKPFDHNKIHNYGELLSSNQLFFKDFPWHKISLADFEIMLQCDFFNPLWITKSFFHFLVHQKSGFIQSFYNSKFLWLEKFHNDFFRTLLDEIDDGNIVPQIFIESVFHTYSVLCLERVLPYAIKHSDISLVRRCLRSRKKILASCIWPEDANTVSPWMAACGKSIWAVSSRLALRCQKRLVLDDVENMCIALRPLCLPALLQITLLESVLEPFTNCTPYFWLDKISLTKSFYSS